MLFLAVTLPVLDFEDVKLWFFCSVYFVRFNKKNQIILLFLSVSPVQSMLFKYLFYLYLKSKSLLLTGECHKWSHYFLLESLAYSHIQIMSYYWKKRLIVHLALHVSIVSLHRLTHKVVCLLWVDLHRICKPFSIFLNAGFLCRIELHDSAKSVW